MWMELAGSCESLLEIACARRVGLRGLSDGLDGTYTRHSSPLRLRARTSVS